MPREGSAHHRDLFCFAEEGGRETFRSLRSADFRRAETPNDRFRLADRSAGGLLPRRGAPQESRWHLLMSSTIGAQRSMIVLRRPVWCRLSSRHRCHRDRWCPSGSGSGCVTKSMLSRLCRRQPAIGLVGGRGLAHRGRRFSMPRKAAPTFQRRWRRKKVAALVSSAPAIRFAGPGSGRASAGSPSHVEVGSDLTASAILAELTRVAMRRRLRRSTACQRGRTEVDFEGATLSKCATPGTGTTVPGSLPASVPTPSGWALSRDRSPLQRPGGHLGAQRGFRHPDEKFLRLSSTASAPRSGGLSLESAGSVAEYRGRSARNTRSGALTRKVIAMHPTTGGQPPLRTDRRHGPRASP